MRSDLKGRGLGWRLMQHLIDYARAEGLEAITGSVLEENTTMLRMCEEFGFTCSTDLQDRGVWKARLELLRRSGAVGT